MVAINISESKNFIVASRIPSYLPFITPHLEKFGKLTETVSTPAELINLVNKLSSGTIFFPHWSWKIPIEILTKFHCIGFHPTDLPLGRGGSPFQNLIRDGVKNTVISSFLINNQMDGGDIIYKTSFEIPDSNIDDILESYAHEIEKHVEYIISRELFPKKQMGRVTEFTRILDNSLNFDSMELLGIYNEIRMVDGAGYMPAKVEIGQYTIFFSDAKLNDESVTAMVTITKRGKRVKA